MSFKFHKLSCFIKVTKTSKQLNIKGNRQLTDLGKENQWLLTLPKKRQLITNCLQTEVHTAPIPNSNLNLIKPLQITTNLQKIKKQEHAKHYHRDAIKTSTLWEIRGQTNITQGEKEREGTQRLITIL